jgi:hypothetical protein
MKFHPSYLAAPVFLIAGILAGRELFPKIVPAPEPGTTTLSTRGKRKVIRVQKADDSGLAASPTDLQGLLELVDTRDRFHTSTLLRASLGELSRPALESLLLEVEDHSKSDPRSSTLRMSLINHLVAKDPFHALDFVLAQDNPSLQHSFINIIMSGAARVDLNAARQALALIEDPRTKQLAEMALINSDAVSSSADLLALLEGSKIMPQFITYQHGGMWGSYDGWGGGFHNYSVPASGVLVKLAQQDLAAAEKYARDLKNPHERGNAMMQIASGLAQSDPDLALEWARNLGNNQSRNQTLANVIGIIARDDPKRAISLSDEVTHPKQLDSVISTIASTWANNDPMAAIDWLKTLPKTKATLQAASNTAVRMGQTDPLGAIAVLDTLPGNNKANFISNIVTNWANRDFDGAKNWIMQQDDPGKLQQVLPGVLSRWVREDPVSVANFLASKADDRAAGFFASQYSSVASYWANQDRTAALNWANGLEKTELRREAVRGVYQTWASEDPAEAAQYLGSISDPGNRKHLLNSVAGSWATQDPAAARTWLNTLPANERFEAAQSTISTLGYSDPRLAADLIDRMVEQAAGNEEQTRKIYREAANVATYWSSHAPQDAAEWAAGITSEEKQANAYRNIASTWAQFDPPAAASWIDTLPPGTSRDRATERLVDQIKQQDPSAAFEWANSMNDDNQRYQSIQNVVRQWQSTNPVAAREAIESASITPDQQEELLGQLK